MNTDFDRVADVYDTAIAGKKKEWTIKSTLASIEQIHPLKGTCLDIGCGTGLYTKAVLRKGVTVVGMDISQSMIKKAQTSFSAILVNANAEQPFPFRNHSFNFVIAMDALTYFHDLSKVLSEALRILKPHGYFFAVVPNHQSVIRKIAKIGNFGSYAASTSIEKHLFNKDFITSLFAEHFPCSGVRIIRPVPGFAGKIYDPLPSWIKKFFRNKFIGLGLLGWGCAP